VTETTFRRRSIGLGVRQWIPVIVLASVLGLAGCGTDDGSAPIRDAVPSTLVGTAWRVLSVAGQSPAAGAKPTIAFAAGELKGGGGCNSYAARYEYDASSGAIAIADLQATAAACLDDSRTRYEGLYFETIVQVTSASTDPTGTLYLNGPGGQVLLVPLR
jgi:heat shock protein HslJ